MNKFLLSTTLLMFIAFAGFSQQVQKNFYQTFDIKDDVSTLKFDFPCKVEYKKTANQRAMVETFVTWSTGNYQTLDFLIKEGEYNTVLDASALGMAFAPKKPVLNDIVLKDGRVIKPKITVVVFLPESFYQQGDNFFSRCVEDTPILASSATIKNELKSK